MKPKSPRKRAYCMTLNNPTDEEKAFLLSHPINGCVRGIYAFEVGEQGTPHIQGFVRFKSAKTMSAVKKIVGSSRWHLEATRGTDFENWTYCQKDGEVIREFGTEPLEEGDDPWTHIMHMVENGFDDFDIIRAYPAIAMRCQSAIAKFRQIVRRKQAKWRDMDVRYVWGPTESGKTRSVLYDEEGNYIEDVYRVDNPKNPWDGYEGESHVVFEEFRSQFLMSDMLNWVDGHPCSLPARYADRWADFTKVTIISNWPLERQYETVQQNSPETWAAFKRRIKEVVWHGHQDQE